MPLPPVVSREEWLAGSDFNYDFRATVDDRVAPAQIFYRGEAELSGTNRPWSVDLRGDWPGISAFLQTDGKVFHTYSTFGRWIEEEWAEPKGRATPLGLQVGGPSRRLPDEYDQA
jgi:predicted dithiol-disulfide oxidoreductase (DUF899 family)